MNCEQMLNEIADAIRERPIGNGRRFLVLIRNGKFLCVNKNVIHLEKEVIGIFSESDLEKGLAVSQWNQLRTRCGCYLKENPECPLVRKQ